MCCNPTRPELLDVRLRLKVKGVTGERILNFRNPNDARWLTGSSGRVVFIVHGFLERMSTSHWPTDMRAAFADQGDSAILVDWR